MSGQQRTTRKLVCRRRKWIRQLASHQISSKGTKLQSDAGGQGSTQVASTDDAPCHESRLTLRSDSASQLRSSPTTDMRHTETMYGRQPTTPPHFDTLGDDDNNSQYGIAEARMQETAADVLVQMTLMGIASRTSKTKDECARTPAIHARRLTGRQDRPQRRRAFTNEMQRMWRAGCERAAR